MLALRRHLLHHQWIAVLVISAALLMKVVIPTGFMPVFSSSSITIQICTGTGPMTMTMEMPGMGGDSKKDGHHGKAEQPCAFAGLSSPSLAAADPILLAAAILFIMALGTRPWVPLVTRSKRHLRPPLRGPPAQI